MSNAWEIRQGDALELLRAIEPGSMDAIVTDPPYGLEFMGKTWDGAVPQLDLWTEALRVLRPGAHLIAFGGTRTFHRLACALEDAGFEIRDCLSWLYGSGFPKSLDVSKAIDKAAGAERDVIGSWDMPGRSKRAPEQRYGLTNDSGEITAPASEAARIWAGWGTALKPAWEPAVLCRKPLAGTVAANVQAHGTGALNVDGCRIAGEVPSVPQPDFSQANRRTMSGLDAHARSGDMSSAPGGRWPANVMLDEDAAKLLDEQTGEKEDGVAGAGARGFQTQYVGGASKGLWGAAPMGYGGRGGASRFLYTAKASSGERHYAGKNTHPTVKPVDLMRWLCRLVTPPGGLVLDPFMGSGSTGVAALAEGFRFLGFERDAEYCAIARRRIAGPLFAEAGA